MKRIKTFRLFEATNRSILIDAFRQEVLENKWAAGIIGIGCSFDIRSLGFANVIGAGSKTSIYPLPGGGYGHKSISQGVTFGDANYPTLDECLKGLYMYILRKKVKIQGIKKDVVEKAIDEIGADTIIGKSVSAIDTMVRDHIGKPKGQPLSEMLDSLNSDFNQFGLAFRSNGPDMILMENIGYGQNNNEKSLLHLILPPIIFGVSSSDVYRIIIKYEYPSDTYRDAFFIEYKYTGKTITREGNKIQIPNTIPQEEIKNYISDFAKRRLRSASLIIGISSVDREKLTSLFDTEHTAEIVRGIIEKLISGGNSIKSDDLDDMIAHKMAEVIRDNNTGSQSKLIDTISKKLPEIWVRIKPLLGSGVEQHNTLGDLGF